MGDAESKIVVIEESFAPRVGGKRIERLLLVVHLVALPALRRTGEDAGAALRSHTRVPRRRAGNQAARIDRVKRDVRPNRRVDGGAQLRLILRSGLADAAGEIDQRLLLRQRSQHLRRRFKRAQFLVGIENIELSVIRDECRSVVHSVVRIAYLGIHSQLAGFADVKSLDHRRQGFAVVSEVLLHSQPAGISHDGHQVGRSHILLKKLERGFLRTDLVRNRHG